jgi:uncharacterized membrane protein YkoI
MKRLLPLAALILSGCASITTESDSGDDREDGLEISSVAVPAKVLDAARAGVPGFVLTGADMLRRNGTTVYALEGHARGEDYDIDVTPGGRVLRIDR